MLARVQITDTQQQGTLFVPMHWTKQYASQGRMGTLVNPVVDPISNQPESKHTPVRIKTYQAAWYGFILSRHPLKFKPPEYLVKVTGEQFYRYELADTTVPETWQAWTRHVLCKTGDETSQWQEYSDLTMGIYRAARILDNQLESIIFVAPTIDLPERSWLTGLFEKSALKKDERLALLTGKPPLGTEDIGPIVCSCFNVGEKTIQAAIKEKALKSHQEVGHCLKAGTNCGSCIPEIKALL